MAKTIISHIPEHTTFVELFAGGANVLFQKPRSKVEVINDNYGELVNFYRVAQNHHSEMLRYAHYMLSSRQWFELLKKTDPETLTDIQRSVRFFVLQKTAYGGNVVRQDYAIHIVKRSNFSVPRMEEMIEQTHKRLQGVQIENLPYEKVLEKYDRKATFYFADPPYYGIRLYKTRWEHEDFAKLASNLKGIEGKFLLTLNDHPEVRKLFADFSITEVPITYTLKGVKKVLELLIKNY